MSNHPPIPSTNEKTDKILKELGYETQPKAAPQQSPQSAPFPHLGSLYTKYLHGEELGTQPKTVTIQKITQEKVTPHPSLPTYQKWCLWVSGLPQGMPTGILFGAKGEKELVSIFGKADLASLIGKPVTIFTQPVNVGGQTKLAIHFRGA
jgi:hypothetical protein